MPRRVEVGLHAAGLAEEWRSVRVCWLDLAKIRKLKRSAREISSQEKKRIGVNREKRQRASEAALAIAMAMKGEGFAMSPRRGLEPCASTRTLAGNPTVVSLNLSPAACRWCVWKSVVSLWQI